MNDSNNLKPDSLQPQSNYFKKAVEIENSIDRLLVFLFPALSAGIIYVLINQSVPVAAGILLMAALICFIIGIGHTLYHIANTSKLLYLAESLINGSRLVPEEAEKNSNTYQLYKQIVSSSHKTFISQLIYLITGISFCGISIIFLFWEYSWRAILLILILSGISLLIPSIYSTWKDGISHSHSHSLE